ncbi:hypothetical protein MKX01_031269 [Papaver californicum]|nr:hypothetical protein MKX01_031269 [Papaver californicum]
MNCTLDSKFKVGFGVDLNCLGGKSKEANKFMKAFDNANELTYWRYCNLFWKLKRNFNIGSEATLKKNIKIVDKFVYGVIQNKRELLSVEGYINEKEDILSRFLMTSEKDPEKMTDKYLRLKLDLKVKANLH